MKKRNLPKQPPVYVSYFAVGKFLYASLFLFIAESIYYGIKLHEVLNQNSTWVIGFWMWCFMFSFIHIFLVLMDGWSRFQNYKRIKDQLFMYGFQPKIANNYLVSKCQRQALTVAAQELGLEKEVVRFFKLQGIKWYHFVPYFMIQDPFFFFKNHFWNRTFLEKYYPPKFDYRHVSQPSKPLYKTRSSVI